MSNSPETYLLDANVFIQAKRKFYPFDVCPGYWKALCWYQQTGLVASVDKIRDELERGGDDLWTWVENTFGKANFQDTAGLAGEYGPIVAWVQAQTQFTQAAKAEFMTVADGWLAAASKAGGHVLVTMEEHKPEAKSTVPLVNVCRAFDIETISPFEMLRRLCVRLDWNPPDTSQSCEK